MLSKKHNQTALRNRAFYYSVKAGGLFSGVKLTLALSLSLVILAEYEVLMWELVK
jgi:hypothetical protein